LDEKIQALEEKVNVFTDSRDGKVYRYVKIGTQIWMAENLAYKLMSGCWAYDYDETNVATYGYLYDWNTAMNGAGSSATNPSNVQGICPDGWHLPSDAEWQQLIDTLGGAEIAGNKLKEVGTTHWDTSNEDVTNEFGFTALPGGLRHNSGDFYVIRMHGYWWSATDVDTDYALSRHLFAHNSSVDNYSEPKGHGFSVRCVKNN